MLTVRYYAGARAAAGVSEETADVTSLVELRRDLTQRHGDRLGAVLAVSTFLVDGRPLRGDDVLIDGTTVEVLPPFAGG